MQGIALDNSDKQSWVDARSEHSKSNCEEGLYIHRGSFQSRPSLSKNREMVHQCKEELNCLHCEPSRRQVKPPFSNPNLPKNAFCFSSSFLGREIVKTWNFLN